MGMSETDTTTGNHSLLIVARVSPGPGPVSEPYVTRLKGTNEQREPQSKWVRKLWEEPEKYVYFHPEAEGVAGRADPKE